MSMDIPDDRDRTDTLAQRLRGKNNNKGNQLFYSALHWTWFQVWQLRSAWRQLRILHKGDKQRFWGSLVYRHSYCMVFAYLVGCRINTHEYHFTATPVKKTAILLCSTRRRYRLRIPLTLLPVDNQGDERPLILVGLVHSYLEFGRVLKVFVISFKIKATITNNDDHSFNMINELYKVFFVDYYYY